MFKIQHNRLRWWHWMAFLCRSHLNSGHLNLPVGIFFWCQRVSGIQILFGILFFSLGIVHKIFKIWLVGSKYRSESNATIDTLARLLASHRILSNPDDIMHSKFKVVGGKDWRLLYLGCGATICRTRYFHLIPWRWKQHIPPKRSYLSIQQYRTSQTKSSKSPLC